MLFNDRTEVAFAATDDNCSEVIIVFINHIFLAVTACSHEEEGT